MRDHRPTFEQVYVRLRERGPARVLSSRATEYTVMADFRGGRETIVACPRRGEVRVHADCWGDAITCQGTRAGGIYNGDPSIYDWYRQSRG